MKKLLFSFALLLSTFVASAQNYTFESFLNVRSLGTSTNGVGITNLVGVVTNVGMIHSTNVYYTNLSGSILRGAAYTNTGSTFSLFKDVPLFTLRDGRLPTFTGPLASNPIANQTNYTISTLTLNIALSSPWGTNGPIGINIAPVWDATPNVAYPGTNTFQGHPNTPTSTADDWSIVIPTGAGYTTLATNVPIWKWPGARALRIRSITNQFVIGGETAITNAPYIYRLGISAYVP